MQVLPELSRGPEKHRPPRFASKPFNLTSIRRRISLSNVVQRQTCNFSIFFLFPQPPYMYERVCTLVHAVFLECGCTARGGDSLAARPNEKYIGKRMKHGAQWLMSGGGSSNGERRRGKNCYKMRKLRILHMRQRTVVRWRRSRNLLCT